MSREKPLILVVDDEVHILHVVSLKLRNAGYLVVTAPHGAEALRVAIEQAPDLVITDYQMPYLTGLELSRELRSHETTANTPVLMLTARSDGLGPDHLNDTNITRVLTKPFSPREVLTCVQQLLNPPGEVKRAS